MNITSPRTSNKFKPNRVSNYLFLRLVGVET